MMRRMILCLAWAAASPFVCVVITGFNAVDTCVEIKILWRVHATPGDARPRLGQLRAGPRRVGRSQDPGGEQGRGAAAVPRRGGRGDLFKSLRGRRPDSSDVRALVLEGD